MGDEEVSDGFACDGCGDDISEEVREAAFEGQILCPHCGHVNDFDSLPF